ncbi:hypothetical protein [Agaribacter marinus]|uniref:Agarase n=1 Tax=Agaribacter marinus TaxID=1431249 RepID=A0AA37WJ89_9ALTE|nr:hypothetical protein [Agaribacter marinus]GLR71777.1 hypothetical protein GCM10007852_26850 [Agaribacter marinus]
MVKHKLSFIALSLILASCGGGGSDSAPTPTPPVTPPPVTSDTTPSAFTFTDLDDVNVSSQTASNQITVSGINAASAISVTGGEYSTDGGATFTSESGTVDNGDEIIVRAMSSADYDSSVEVVLTIGGVSDTFTITTETAPPAVPTVDVNLDLAHSVNGVETFDRSKWIVLHAAVTDNEWDSNEQRDSFLEDYDVYLGRNNGAMPWQLSRLQATSTNGFLDTDQMVTYGNQAIGWYAADTAGHKHEARASNMMFGGQPIMYPMAEYGPVPCSGQDCDGNQWLAGFEEGAKFYSEFLTHYFGTGGTTGEMKPTIIEVLNEPFVHADDVQATRQQISEFHSVVAQKIHEDHPDVLVGGYTAAFPQFEAGNFNQWENNWRLFIDEAGADMDFYSVHIYDGGNNGQPTYRSGSNAEAILDMIEHYGKLSTGEVKPFVISEFGHFDRPITNAGPYSRERDWFGVRSFSSQMIQFMERPDQIVSAIPFMILKANWVGNNGIRDDGSRYGPRLLRLSNEDEGGLNVVDDESNEWVYTDFIKFFELWSDVGGTRVDTKATDQDMQVDAYVEGNTAYVIMNNLEFEDKVFTLNMAGMGDNQITAISSKQVYQDSASLASVFEEVSDIALNETAFNVHYQATKIVKITFANDINVDGSLKESKHFADTYKQAISANVGIDFTINGVQATAATGEAMLRMGLGRAHNTSLTPTVMVNGTEVSVPVDFRGYDQNTRDEFFGVIEVPVPYSLIQESNSIELTFEDGGGFVTSLSLQVFEASREIVRTPN